MLDANIFDEALGVLKKGWHTVKQAGGAILNKAVKFANWLRRESCLKYELRDGFGVPHS